MVCLQEKTTNNSKQNARAYTRIMQRTCKTLTHNREHLTHYKRYACARRLRCGRSSCVAATALTCYTVCENAAHRPRCARVCVCVLLLLLLLLKCTRAQLRIPYTHRHAHKHATHILIREQCCAEFESRCERWCWDRARLIWVPVWLCMPLQLSPASPCVCVQLTLGIWWCTPCIAVSLGWVGEDYLHLNTTV